jgi:hypothetical protein
MGTTKQRFTCSDPDDVVTWSDDPFEFAFNERKFEIITERDGDRVRGKIVKRAPGQLSEKERALYNRRPK